MSWGSQRSHSSPSSLALRPRASSSLLRLSAAFGLLVLLGSLFPLFTPTSQAAPVSAAALADQYGQDGVQLDNWADTAVIDQRTTLAANAGTAWMRIALDAWGYYASPEPAGMAARNAAPNWHNSDYLVETARAKGLKLMAILGFRQDSAWTSNEADWRYYVRAIATHYRGKIAAYEVSNEPDLPGNVNNETTANYAMMVQAAAEEVQANDPAALVVGGALAYSGGADLTYIDQWFQATRDRYGHSPQIDVLSVHEYTADPNFFRTRVVPALRDSLTRFGLANRPIWLTEHGFPSGANEAAQADHVRNDLSQILGAGFAKVFWWSLVDRSDFTDTYWGTMGLFRRDGSPKPALDAFRQLAATSAASNPPPSAPPAASITFTSPASSATVIGTKTVQVKVANANPASVVYSVDSVQKAQASSPLAWKWDTTRTRNGVRTLTARAYDAQGKLLASASINVRVANSGSRAADVDQPTGLAYLPLAV